MASIGEISASPDGLIGTWRRFGIVGPVNQIIGVDHQLSDGDWMMRVSVLDTGEEVDYKLTDVMDSERGLMFAIAFDLVVAGTAEAHPKGVSQAYADIGARLEEFGFERVQGSLSTNKSEDLANLFAAIIALKALPWLPFSVQDIRAFRVGSDFTKIVKT